MSSDYKGLLKGFHDPLEIAKAIIETYGGEQHTIRFCPSEKHFQVQFAENWTPEESAMGMIGRMRAKVQARHRQMNVFVDGDCASDYADLTTEPMTYVSVGRWGDCEKIIGGLVAKYGGYVQDESGSQEWEAR